MADDLAFVFNDPDPNRALSGTRPAGVPARPVPHAAAKLAADIDWMTLRQAHDQTSIPISTLRKWAKKGKVRARLVRVAGKELRFVAFGDVVDRARVLERTIEPVKAETVIDLRDSGEVQFSGPSPVHTPPVAAVESAAGTAADIDLDRPQPDTEPDPEPAQQPTAPEGSILVPLDAWDRLLGQLGNLHEAGQALADARERAAKAETEAEFLKERLREMRTRVEEAELAFDLQHQASTIPEAPSPPEPVLQIGWRRLRDRWLGGR